MPTTTTAATPDRRSLRFASMGEILADVERLNAAPSRRSIGSWTPAQLVDHVTRLITRSLDGFEFKAPLMFRIVAPVMIKFVGLQRPFKPGIKLTKTIQAALYDPEATWDGACLVLQSAIDRIEAGERMTHPSPVLGKLTHEEWVQVHCRHAELHLSFIRGEGVE